MKTLDDRGIDEVLLATLSAQLDQASLQIRGEPGVDWEERVHRVRTGLKGARATLRLLRQGIGARAWRRANEALRDAGQYLQYHPPSDVTASYTLPASVATIGGFQISNPTLTCGTGSCSATPAALPNQSRTRSELACLRQTICIKGMVLSGR